MTEDRTSNSVRAFVDESYRRGPGGSGVYVFAAVIVEAKHEEDIRGDLLRALPRGADRFHWHKDSDRVRRRLLEVVAGTDLVGFTLVQSHVQPRRGERARQHMLWSLAFELLHRSVPDVVFEARDRGLNRRDQVTLASICRTPAASSLRYTFARPLDEPLLWLPDYVAAIHGAGRLLGGTSWRDRLPDGLLEVIEVAPRRR